MTSQEKRKHDFWVWTYTSLIAINLVKIISWLSSECISLDERRDLDVEKLLWILYSDYEEIHLIIYFLKTKKTQRNKMS